MDVIKIIPFAIIIVSLGIIIATNIYLLAQANILFTTVRENRVKLVMRNEQFHTCLISSEMFIFQKQVEEYGLQDQAVFIHQHFTIDDSEKTEADKWNVWQLKAEHTIDYNTGFAGIRWIGIPPFRSVYSYNQVETVFEQKGSETGGDVRVVDITTNCPYDYVPLEDKTFVHLVSGAETEENLPVNVKFAVTIRIVNPYKAVLLTDTWLSTVFDQLGPELRILIGSLRFSELNEKVTSVKLIDKYLRGEAITINRKLSKQGNLEETKEISSPLEEGFQPITIQEEGENFYKSWIVRYGVEVKRVQIQTVDPASDLAREFIQASTRQYVEQENALAEAKRIEITANAEASKIRTIAQADADAIDMKREAERRRIQAIYKEVAEYGPIGSYTRFAEALENTNVTYLNLGGNTLPPAIAINPEEKGGSNG